MRAAKSNTTTASEGSLDRTSKESAPTRRHARRAPAALGLLLGGTLSAALIGGVLVAPVLLAGCGDDDGEQAGGGGSGGGAGSLEAGMIFMDLAERVHLADVDHEGLFLDFGTPAQSKYTAGDWDGSQGQGGWGRRGTDGDRTYANVGRRGRIYFDLARAEERKVRLRLRPRGTGALTPYINGNAIQAVFFEGEGWQEVEFTMPAEHLKRGENYLMLVFGGTTSIAGEEVAVQLESAWIGAGAPPAELPSYGSYQREVSLGEGGARAGLAFAAPIAFRYYVEVPERAHLRFAFGQEGAAGSHARVRVHPEGVSAVDAWSGMATGSWDGVDVDLTAFAGKVVELSLEADAAPGASGRVAFAEPRIVVPVTEERPELTPARNVIVVLVDTLRASKLRAFNPESRVQTPVLDGLAEHGAVFELAQSTENWTKPSVAGVLTGLQPRTHGARTQSASLPQSVLMVSEHLKDHGFTTGAFVANGYVSGRFGFDQGWDNHRNFMQEDGRSREAAEVFQIAGDWIEQHKDERFFAYVHTVDPHVPYDPPEEDLQRYDSRSDYDGVVRARSTGEQLVEAKAHRLNFTPSDLRRLRALHDGEITYHDREMGRFVERLQSMGVWDDTVFVFVSDHGEEFNDHGSFGHGHSIYQELLHVPLLVHAPGRVPARRISHAVSTIDISPTVLELADVDPLPYAEGRSLVPDIFGEPPNRPAVAFSEFQDERRVLVSSRWKFITRGNLTVSLFDLEADPGEEHQLDVTTHPVAARYLRILQGQYLGASDPSHWLDGEQGQGERFEADRAVMDQATREQLEAIGYVIDDDHGTN